MYWVLPIHVVYFGILPIQYNIIQYYEKTDLRKVKYIREGLNEMETKRKSVPRSGRKKKKLGADKKLQMGNKNEMNIQKETNE